MRIINIRLLTNQYQTMFYFYKDKLGLEAVYGNENFNYEDINKYYEFLINKINLVTQPIARES
ncbi:VOC family protein [Staphylococcus epidermidis]|uniref:VOC family protein n=1 Tax=Staphylococcus epidermidis TaxID=1282 RepID=UPI00138AB4C5|nr:VOC family protein [Staphylococcus epidermidis]MBF2283649.1 VOC family protein [Staphylococcus epidermidis]MBF2289688.1 VOC family protein [Staphylococcus epidermidis]MBF2290764.1 VOC family protein [Staphylococcus epidermidis]MBF2293514.1 VOC family protein [Staphylococcus epidermidis]MBF2297081.1 VOC family protein [Staphylococcus epidermidis]